MRVLMIGASHEIFVMGAAPLGLAYLAATLRRAGHDVRIVDVPTIVKEGADPAARLATELASFPPDLLVCSIRNLDWVLWPTNVFSYKPAEKVIRLLGGYTSAPIVIGGPGFTICPEPILRRLGSRYVGVVGEGELTLTAIARAVEQGGDPREVERGVCYLDDGGRYVERPVWQVPVLDALPLPARDLLDNEAYTTCDGRVVGNIQTSRGCSRSCIFCTYPNIEGRQVRLRDPFFVAAELADAQCEHGLDSFFFVDSVFNLDRGHVEGICHAILERGIDISWGANFHPSRDSLELLPLMRKAGCVHLALGADSLNEPALVKLRKGHDTAQVLETTRLARDLDMEVFLSVFLGSPGETMDDVRTTLEVLDTATFAPTSWEGEYPVMVQPGIRIYPKTPLQRIAVEEGLIDWSDDLLEPRFYISPGIQRDQLLALVEECLDEHPLWMAPGLPHLMRGAPNLDRLMAQQMKGYRDPGVVITLTPGPPPEPAPEPRANRRHQPRFPVDIRGECWIAETAVVDRVVNISRGGLCFAGYDGLAEDAEVELRLFLSNAVPIQARGRVVWMMGPSRASNRVAPGTGIVFTDLLPSDAAVLARYLDELEQNHTPLSSVPLPMGRSH